MSVFVLFISGPSFRIKCIADWENHISIGASNNLWLPQLSTCISRIDISRITIEYFVQKISTTLTFHQVFSQDCVIHFPVWRRQKPWPWQKSYAQTKEEKKMLSIEAPHTDLRLSVYVCILDHKSVEHWTSSSFKESGRNFKFLHISKLQFTSPTNPGGNYFLFVAFVSAYLSLRGKWRRLCQSFFILYPFSFFFTNKSVGSCVICIGLEICLDKISVKLIGYTIPIYV